MRGGLLTMVDCDLRWREKEGGGSREAMRAAGTGEGRGV
jgi:hypothetical protein